jgi:hypothetical protein
MMERCMKVFGWALVALFLYSTSSMAEPASDKSIHELLVVSKAHSLLDSVMAQLSSAMNNSVQQALQGKTPTAGEQQAIDTMKSSMTALLQGELSWDKMEPMYIRIYKSTFTEEEVAGMLAFYKTPAGQAVINKMPTMMQGLMGEMQKMIAGMAPQMQKIQQDFAASVAAANK